jgi:hypothetical protein
MDRLKEELDNRKKPGTRPKPAEAYLGTYWNSTRNFKIAVAEVNGKLQMKLQALDSETFELTHHENDTFSFWMPFSEVARRGRYITDFGASYYLVNFSSSEGNTIDGLTWAWDPNLPHIPETFTK